jgi:hypothetical protein
LPLTASTTLRTLFGEMRTYFDTALTSIVAKPFCLIVLTQLKA